MSGVTESFIISVELKVSPLSLQALRHLLFGQELGWALDPLHELFLLLLQNFFLALGQGFFGRVTEFSGVLPSVSKRLLIG